ncbi:MAG: CRISPR-associated protein, Csd2 family [Candidatus Ozemobacter sibiricus]|uniref:CRISPR-associated protein, Csd2 family n=1 Tax=Candidatus Ozemobacter sibiricus TaxID=2268124 RepID=A0A367ZLR2_9BACT|nr:MAG: CRISPR-associated protein, Csd2 family [Candidatus Ozemobacter sibiricus]
MSDPIKERYDFVLVFDVQDGNPNGDPDAGNLPRLDPETGRGLVTDVCLKRKVRNFVQLVKEGKTPFAIYVKEKAVLGKAHVEAFKALNIVTGQASKKPIPANLVESLDGIDWPEGLSVVEGDDGTDLVVEADADKKLVKEWLKEVDCPKPLKELIKKALDEAKPRKPTAAETERGRTKMCQDFYDIRTFGAVMSLKSAPNCGQVRGPVQMTFARSVDPVIVQEHSITRMAVATEAEAEKQSGDNRTMGRKNTIPYGLYVAHGFVSPHLAAQTGFSQDDLKLLWEALLNMFEHDRSAARGLMATRKLVIFKHDTALGDAPAHRLFERVKIEKKVAERPARSFDDYRILIDGQESPSSQIRLDLSAKMPA